MKANIDTTTNRQSEFFTQDGYYMLVATSKKRQLRRGALSGGTIRGANVN